MTTPVLLTLAVGYGFVVLILILILLSTTLPVVVRASATVLAAVLFFTTYWGIGELRGWPSDTEPPHDFRLHWARIVEPDKASNDDGAIFLWIEELDADNYPVGVPRAYELPYTLDLAETVRANVGAIANGEEIEGEIAEDGENQETGERLSAEVSQQQNGTASPVGERVFRLDEGDLTFGAMPGPVTPEKVD